MGFAVVDVNMRGTGCSGGAFDFFEPLQNLDGYDVIETIAHQPWVRGPQGRDDGHLLRRDQPAVHGAAPAADLEAISPLSVIDATATTLYPGGILNTGFAVAWAEQRQQDAEPAGPNSGQPWAYEADPRRRHDVRGQPGAARRGGRPAWQKIAANSHYNPSVADPLDPVTFVNKINVPMFMACQWEDEQTGGHCAELARHFTGTTQKWFTFTNGAHIDSLDPDTYNRWYDFLELYVAHQAPIENSAIMQAAAPVIYQEAMGLPEDRRRHAARRPDPAAADLRTGARRRSKQLPQVRVLFDNGAGTSPLGSTNRRRPLPRVRAVASRRSRSRARRLAPGTSGRAARSTTQQPTARASTRSPRTRTRCR